MKSHVNMMLLVEFRYTDDNAMNIATYTNMVVCGTCGWREYFDVGVRLGIDRDSSHGESITIFGRSVQQDSEFIFGLQRSSSGLA